MKFFYRYVNRLKEPEKVSPDIDPAMLGIILHEIMKNLYQSFTGTILSADKLDSMIRNKQLLESTINRAINEKFRDGRNDRASGSELIIRDVLMEYLIRILHTDKALAPITILNLEDSFSFGLSFLYEGKDTKVITGGKVDRIDIVNGVTRIVDYKTGSVAESINSTDDLFADDRKKDADGWLQTLLYCEVYRAINPDIIIRPSIYKIKKLTGAMSTDKLRLKSGSRNSIDLDNYETIREEFISGLKTLISIIFSDTEPFVKTTDAWGKCTYCPYRILCMR
jgi:hypothetical protein